MRPQVRRWALSFAAPHGAVAALALIGCVTQPDLCFVGGMFLVAGFYYPYGVLLPDLGVFGGVGVNALALPVVVVALHAMVGACVGWLRRTRVDTARMTVPVAVAFFLVTTIAPSLVMLQRDQAKLAEPAFVETGDAAEWGELVDEANGFSFKHPRDFVPAQLPALRPDGDRLLPDARELLVSPEGHGRISAEVFRGTPFTSLGDFMRNQDGADPMFLAEPISVGGYDGLVLHEDWEAKTASVPEVAHGRVLRMILLKGTDVIQLRVWMETERDARNVVASVRVSGR